MALSWTLSAVGVYRWVAQRPLFDTALFLILAGLFFHGLKWFTTPLRTPCFVNVPLFCCAPTLTLIAVLIAAGVLWQLYLYYTYAPQTRDGKIRADVVPLATDVSGKVDAVHIHDNQVVHKGAAAAQPGQSTAAQCAGSGRGRR